MATIDRSRVLTCCAVLSALAFASALAATACHSSQDDCEGNPLLGCGPYAPGGGGSGGTGGNDGGGGTGGGTPPGCVPADNADPVEDSCGVFVSTILGDDGNAGTKAAPFATINAAIAAAGSGAVYVCAEPFT